MRKHYDRVTALLAAASLACLLLLVGCGPQAELSLQSLIGGAQPAYSEALPAHWAPPPG